MLECVINISEGRDPTIIEKIGDAAGSDLLDIHIDADHNRSVFTLLGESAPRSVTEIALQTLNICRHSGVHPRIGVVDVVPFVPLEATTMADAVRARDEFAAWVSTEYSIPCFLYGPERSLPEVRKHAFTELKPNLGPGSPHPTAGAIAVGARQILVAYNLWLAEPDLEIAKTLARSLRSPEVRALGLTVGPHVQVSMNLIDPVRVGPDHVYDIVSSTTKVARCELVGLIPQEVLYRVPKHRWNQLGLSEECTIEARLNHRP